MSTGYGWEGLRQLCTTLLGARHVSERLCGGLDYVGRCNKCSPLPFFAFMLSLITDPLFRIHLFEIIFTKNLSKYSMPFSLLLCRHLSSWSRRSGTTATEKTSCVAGRRTCLRTWCRLSPYLRLHVFLRTCGHPGTQNRRYSQATATRSIDNTELTNKVTN